MRVDKVLRVAALGCWLASSGCMTLREIPRGEYAARPERKGVRVETREGLLYEFDWATLGADTLTGYRNRLDVEGPIDQVAVLQIPVEDIQRMTERGVDWRRTGLAYGTVAAGTIAIIFSAARHPDSTPATSGGGKGFNPSPRRR
jgi:hypothetical protein